MPVSAGVSCTLVAEFISRSVPMGAVVAAVLTLPPLLPPQTVCGKGSALQVTWNVGTACSPLRLESLDEWCGGNVFEEDHAHGVRTLVEDLTLLSPIE